ncbi:hypothetical protein KUCAC02_013405, partial [Chaenocephalus aceratus]
CEASKVKGCRDNKVQLKLDNRCQEPLNKTAYKTETIIIKCDKGNKDDSRVKFFCKVNGMCPHSTLESTGVEWNQLKEVTELLSGKYNWRLESNSAQKDGVSWIPIVAAVVCAALLGLLLFLVFRYKHACCSKNKIIEEAHNVEDRAYDEIQEPPLVTGPGTALQSLYVTANAPTNPSASLDYSTINAPTNPSASLDYSTITAHNISAEAGETYSTVRDQAQSAAYSTVNHPSRLPEDPFYSSVNQQT